MNEHDLQELARQLRRPSGEMGAKVAEHLLSSNAALTKKVLAHLQVQRGHHVFEIGPGNGGLSQELVKSLGPDGWYIAVEHALDMVHATAESLADVAPCPIEVIEGDVLEVDLQADRFDRAFAVNVLYFVDDIPELFGRLFRALKPGGRLCLGIRSAPRLRQMPVAQYEFRIRPLDEYFVALHQAGFSNIQGHFMDDGTTELNGNSLPLDGIVVSATK